MDARARSESLRPRRARRDEATPVADLWLRSRYASIPAIPPPVHSDDEVREYFASVVLPRRQLWVIEIDGGLVALLVLDNGWLAQLYVDPEWTGRGLGSRLVNLAKELHPNSLDLWTFQSNVGARRFYEQHEFVVLETTDGANEEGAPDVHYHWPSTAIASSATRTERAPITTHPRRKR
jgi:GNAT superfamily N-acetyltransferase